MKGAEKKRGVAANGGIENGVWHRAVKITWRGDKSEKAAMAYQYQRSENRGMAISEEEYEA